MSNGLTLAEAAAELPSSSADSASSLPVNSPSIESRAKTQRRKAVVDGSPIDIKGKALLVVSQIAFGSRTRDFRVSAMPPSCGRIEPDAACSVTVTYRPSTVGQHATTLNVQSNDPAGVTIVEIVGSATAPASPNSPKGPAGSLALARAR